MKNAKSSSFPLWECLFSVTTTYIIWQTFVICPRWMNIIFNELIWMFPWVAYENPRTWLKTIAVLSWHFLILCWLQSQFLGFCNCHPILNSFTQLLCWHFKIFCETTTNLQSRVFGNLTIIGDFNAKLTESIINVFLVNFIQFQLLRFAVFYSTVSNQY